MTSRFDPMNPPDTPTPASAAPPVAAPWMVKAMNELYAYCTDEWFNSLSPEDQSDPEIQSRRASANEHRADLAAIIAAHAPAPASDKDARIADLKRERDNLANNDLARRCEAQTRHNDDAHRIACLEAEVARLQKAGMAENDIVRILRTQLAAAQAEVAKSKETLSAIAAVNVDEHGQVGDAAIKRLIDSHGLAPAPSVAAELVERLKQIDEKLQAGHDAQMSSGKNYSGHFTEARALLTDAIRALTPAAAGKGGE